MVGPKSGFHRTDEVHTNKLQVVHRIDEEHIDKVNRALSPIILVIFKRKIYNRDNIHQIAPSEILNEIRKMVRDW